MIKLIAHRGESAEAPENTMESFLLAWTNGAAEGIEGDFYLTRDGALACMHDDNAWRTGGVRKAIASMTAAEFTALEVGAWKGEEWRGCRPPLLPEVLQSLPDHGEIFVEIKNSGPELVKALNESRKAAGVREDQITVISFHEDALSSIRRLLPNLRTLLLVSPKYDASSGMVSPSASTLVESMRRLDVNGVDCGAAEFITGDYVKDVKSAGFEFHVWTVNDIDTALRFAGFGIDSITTDCPAALRRQWPE